MHDEFVPMMLAPGCPLAVPDPRRADAEGLIAFGGDLSVERLKFAYSHAVFPWFDDNNPPLWWSPDPRCVVPLDDIHVPRRLERRLRQHDFEVTCCMSFEAVMRACAEGRKDGTWIIESMVDAYCALHCAGHALSFEVWRGGELVGGLYGVSIGGLFAAESMFKRQTDMSKVALVYALRTLAAAGYSLFDVQFRTDHLTRFGCVEMSRAEYYERAQIAAAAECLPPEAGPLAVV